MRKIVKFITSFFYLGHSPFMPGTVGSLGGLIVYSIVKDRFLLYVFVMVFLCVLGILFAGEAERVYKRKDASMIVIDEACGMLVTLFLVPYSLAAVLAGFLLFRLFDITKPPPARLIERISGSFGVMGDDLIAAIYANTILQLLTRVWHLL